MLESFCIPNLLSIFPFGMMVLFFSSYAAHKGSVTFKYINGCVL